MTNFDLTPLYRSTIGFDRFAGLFDALSVSEKSAAYPPYNIERTDENDYRISMAVAGFSEDELEIEAASGVLRVRGLIGDAAGDEASTDADNRQLLYHGIAARNFERRFQLADNVQVSGASLTNGLLNIELVREIPEAEKPRKIEIAKTLKAA